MRAEDAFHVNHIPPNYCIEQKMSHDTLSMHGTIQVCMQLIGRCLIMEVLTQLATCSHCDFIADP